MVKVYNINDDVPLDAVYIGRGTLFGNKYIIGVDGTRDEVCDKFINDLNQNQELKSKVLKELHGKNLVCHCKPKRCHGDYLLIVANGIF